uniref:Uncharacterized protein n=1 Tax=Acrobeloides nanus TaxID=290746 RepID=A0A914BZB3_9BILA
MNCIYPLIAIVMLNFFIIAYFLYSTYFQVTVANYGIDSIADDELQKFLSAFGNEESKMKYLEEFFSDSGLSKKDIREIAKMLDTYTVAEIDKLTADIGNYISEKIEDLDTRERILKKIDDLKAKAESLSNVLKEYVTGIFAGRDEL